MHKILIECDVDFELIEDMSKEAKRHGFEFLTEYLKDKHLQDNRIKSCEVTITVQKE